VVGWYDIFINVSALMQPTENQPFSIVQNETVTTFAVNLHRVGCQWTCISTSELHEGNYIETTATYPDSGIVDK